MVCHHTAMDSKGALVLDRRECVGLLAAAAVAPALARAESPRTIALLFDSLISPFWVAAIERLRHSIEARGWSVLEAVSNMDDNRQYEQVQSMIQRKVDGIVMVHTDDKAVIPAIRAANAAGIPLVHFNRPPAPSDAYSVAVVVDNRKLMDDTVTALIEIAQRQGGHYKAVVLLGDLGDANGVHRRDGIQDSVARHGDMVEVVARIATEWNADKAFAGLSNALQAHPDINMLITSSDFLTPQVEQALRTAGKWHPAGQPGHVLIAGFDGDDKGYEELATGYYDVDGVQNLDYEVELTLRALDRLWAGERPARILIDPGFVITQESLIGRQDRMWGYGVWKASAVTSAGSAGGAASGSAYGGTGAITSGTSTGTFTWVLLLAAFLSIGQAMLSLETWRDVLLALLPLSILVGGQLLVLLMGQIDLSMTAVMAIGSIVSAAAMTRHGAHMGGLGASFAGILVCLALGAGIGLFNGVCNALLRIPSFIVTLAVMMAGNGAAVWYGSSVSETTSIGGLPQAFRAIGYGTVGGIPIALVLSIGVLALIHYVLSRTVAGRWLYAVGHNAEAARSSGVPVRGLTIAAFMASGVGAALASVIYTSRIETGTPTLGQNMLLDIIGAAVIGGVSLFGGRGTVWMALGGAAFLCVLDKSLQLFGLSLFIVLAVKGCAIVLAALLDVARSRRTQQA
jgi:ribose/xylose/arabinose/galactoside ABC-type transport system permease subunit/ABC-type sugar transport system substrate-binding protein